jgi:hypothetical protein
MQDYVGVGFVGTPCLSSCLSFVCADYPMLVGSGGVKPRASSWICDGLCNRFRVIGCADDGGACQDHQLSSPFPPSRKWKWSYPRPILSFLLLEAFAHSRFGLVKGYAPPTPGRPFILRAGYSVVLSHVSISSLTNYYVY